mmetsp:Transcript_40329/g.125483  ORF Transcript_40329/g.125483 Transcript_40329/m.125483 type:complete len:448 (+) Transcript_40329:583-1926(+)
MQQNLDREDRLVKEVKASSEKLSQEWLADPSEDEAARSERVEALLRFFLEKLRAASGGRHRQVLEQSQQDFAARNDAALCRYQGLVARHSEHSSEQQRRAERLRDKREEKEREFHCCRAVANWARLACGRRIADEAAAVKSHLDVVRSCMEHARWSAVLKDHAQLELEHASSLAGEVGRQQEHMSQQHRDLVAHYEQCRSLFADFGSFVRSGYSGLNAKADADAAAMARDLPHDGAKVAVLNHAQEEEFDRQLYARHGVMREAVDERTACERQLRVMELKRSRGRDEFERLKSEWEAANRTVVELSQDLQSLDQQKQRWQSLHQEYQQQEFKRVGHYSHDDSKEIPCHAWATSFLFNRRESSNFLPPQHMIMYSAGSAHYDASVAQSFELIGPYEEPEEKGEGAQQPWVVKAEPVAEEAGEEDREGAGGEATEGRSMEGEVDIRYEQ